MKTKKLSMLFPPVFALVSMLVFCNSAGYTQEDPFPPFKIESQQIKISEGNWICVELDEFTQCPKPETISRSYDACKTKTQLKEISTRAGFFDTVLKGRQVTYIVGSPCNSFITEIKGNTTCYCTPRKCYCY